MSVARESGTAIHSVRARPHGIAFTVETGGGSREIWMRTSLPLVPGADVAVALALVPALVEGGRFEVDTPVDETLVRRLPEIATVLRPFQTTGDWTPALPIRRSLELVCPTAASPPRRPDRGVAAFFSGGVDSFATLLRHPGITDLIHVAGLDVPAEEAYADHHGRVLEGVAEVAERVGKSLISVETSARDLYQPALQGPLYFGGILGAVAKLVAPEIEIVYVPSSQSYPWNSSHPLIDHLWGGAGLEVVHDAAELTRPRKLELIADDELARRWLRVCWAGAGDSRYNCCRCEKCLRTMVALETLGRLEEFVSFKQPLDLDAVAAIRLQVRHEVAYWRENLELAISRGARVELIEAIEACLASASPDLRSGSRRSPLPNP